MKQHTVIGAKHDVIRFMGRFPDQSIDSRESMLNTGIWICSKCGAKRIKDPCACGSIYWEKHQSTK